MDDSSAGMSCMVGWEEKGVDLLDAEWNTTLTNDVWCFKNCYLSGDTAVDLYTLRLCPGKIFAREKQKSPVEYLVTLI